MDIPPALREQILQVRRDNPQLTANMSDEDILLLLQQADLATAYGKPLSFRTPVPGGAPGPQPSAVQDFDRLSLDELLVIGQKLQDQQRWDAAEKALQTLRSKALQAGNTHFQALGLFFLGKQKSQCGNQPDALALYQQALELARGSGNLQLAAVILGGMGMAHGVQGQYAQSVAFHRQGIEICRQTGDRRILAFNLGDLGEVYIKMGELDLAQQTFDEVLDIACQTADEGLSAMTFAWLGEIHRLQGRNAPAIEALEKSVELAARRGELHTLCRALISLSSTYSDQGEIPKAIEMQERLLSYQYTRRDGPGAVNCWGALATLHQKTGNLPAVRACYEQGISILEQIDEPHEAARYHFNLALICREQGDAAQARQHFRKSAALFEATGDSSNADRARQELLKP